MVVCHTRNARNLVFAISGQKPYAVLLCDEDKLREDWYSSQSPASVSVSLLWAIFCLMDSYDCLRKIRKMYKKKFNEQNVCGLSLSGLKPYIISFKAEGSNCVYLWLVDRPFGLESDDIHRNISIYWPKFAWQFAA